MTGLRVETRALRHAGTLGTFYWKLLGATWCHSSCHSSPRSPFGDRTVPDETHSYRSAHEKRRTSNKATISELRTTAGTGLYHPSASALQVLALQVLALDARAALRHSVGTPIPVCHITRSLIRKHRLYAQRKKDDWLRRSRNTPFVAQYSNPKRLDLESILRARFAP